MIFDFGVELPQNYHDDEAGNESVLPKKTPESARYTFETCFYTFGNILYLSHYDILVSLQCI